MIKHNLQNRQMEQKKKNEKETQRGAIKKVAVVAGLIGVAGVVLIIRGILNNGSQSRKAADQDAQNPLIVDIISKGENTTLWNRAFSEGLTAFMVKSFAAEGQTLEFLARMAEEGQKSLVK